MKTDSNLKTKVLQGGIYLAARQLIGSLLSMVSVLIIARILGPENYGLVTVATGILFFIFWTGKLGLDAYLIRQPDLPDDAAEQVLAFYNTVGIGFCVLLWFLLPYIANWIHQPSLVPVLRCLIPAIWLEMVGSAAIAMMDRELRFAEVGWVETVAQVANYLLAVPLVLLHWSYWGPITGIVFQYGLLALISHRYHPLSWRWRWQWSFIQTALRCGLAYTGSNLIISLKGLTLPLFVSRLAGLEAVGIIGIASRLADQVGMIRMVGTRLSLSAVAKVIDQPVATRRAISKGMIYQGLVVGLPFALFSCCSTWLIPFMFGKAWLPSAYLFAFIALARLIDTVFNIHISALYAAAHNWDVSRFHFLYVGLFWLAISILLPQFGIWGYGMSEVLVLLSYISIHESLKRLCGSPDYRDEMWLLLATVPALFVGSWWSALGGVSLLILSYSILFSIRPAFRLMPIELHAAWQARRAAASL